ncbi:MAG: type II secretion system protein, partial [Planctomycetota bacterium]
MPRTRTTERSEQAGFSFVELLVALAILSFAFTYGII